MEDTMLSNTFALQVDNSNIPFLNEAAKWGKFLSILGFIFISLFILFSCIAIFTGNSFSSSDLDTELQDMQLPANIAGIIVGIYFLFIALIGFFPCLYLYKFSSKMQVAIKNNDQIFLNKSFSSLKSLFKFWGILTIVGICFFALIIILAVVMGAAFSH